MPNSLVLPVIPSSLPSGLCFTSLQQLLNDFSAHQTVTFPSTFTGVTVSPSAPSDTTQAWLKLDSSGRPIRIYYFAQGAWLSLHPTAPGLTMWYFDALPNFSVFDGGDGSATSLISGPMWQQAKDLNGNLIAAQFPIAAGTLPSTKVLNNGDKGGLEKSTITLDLTNIPPHAHDCQGVSQLGSPGSQFEFFQANEANANPPNNGVTLTTKNSGGGGTPPAAVPFDVQGLPPYIVGYLLQRTSRLWYSS